MVSMADQEWNFDHGFPYIVFYEKYLAECFLNYKV